MGECDRFEESWARYVGVEHCRLSRSGTAALYTALVGMGVGPGDQVIVPSYTYMATALAVLAAGAIPVIADVDDSLTLCPKDLKKRITRHTRAIIPVHMVGLPCDMKKIVQIAEKNGLLVLEDACQAVGGAFEGKPLGSWGQAGAFSFNFFKNMTCGEGEGLLSPTTNSYISAVPLLSTVALSIGIRTRRDDLQFAGHNFRASEIEGAVLNVQLRRIKGMLKTMRGHKKTLLAQGLDEGLKSLKTIV